MAKFTTLCLLQRNEKCVQWAGPWVYAEHPQRYQCHNWNWWCCKPRKLPAWWPRVDVAFSNSQDWCSGKKKKKKKKEEEERKQNIQIKMIKTTTKNKKRTAVDSSALYCWPGTVIVIRQNNFREGNFSGGKNSQNHNVSLSQVTWLDSWCFGLSWNLFNRMRMSKKWVLYITHCQALGKQEKQ